MPIWIFFFCVKFEFSSMTKPTRSGFVVVSRESVLQYPYRTPPVVLLAGQSISVYLPLRKTKHAPRPFDPRPQSTSAIMTPLKSVARSDCSATYTLQTMHIPAATPLHTPDPPPPPHTLAWLWPKHTNTECADLLLSALRHT